MRTQNALGINMLVGHRSELGHAPLAVGVSMFAAEEPVTVRSACSSFRCRQPPDSRRFFLHSTEQWWCRRPEVG